MLKKLIGDKAFYKMVFVIVIPIIIQNGVTQFVNLLDNIMIGQLGTLEMSGVSIANSLLAVFNVVIFGTMSGPGIFTAQFYGKKDNKGIQDTFHYKCIIGLIMLLISLLLFKGLGKTLISFYITGNASDSAITLQYANQYLSIMLWGLFPFILGQVYNSTLRETRDTLLPMVSTTIALFTNFILNYILIFGHFGCPRLGVAGAALATVFARYVECGILIISSHLTIQKHRYLQNIYRSFKIKMDLVKAIAIKSLPLLGNEILWSITQAMITQSYSTRGIEGVAAMNISTTVSSTFMIVCYAMGSAISIIVGQELGANETERAYQYDIYLISFNCFLCILTGILLALVSSIIPSFYNTTDQVKQIATMLLFVCALFIPIRSLYYGCYFTMRAGGKTVLTFIFDSLYSTVVDLSIAFLLSRFTALPLPYLYFAVEFCSVPKVVIGLILIKKKIWISNIVNEF